MDNFDNDFNNYEGQPNHEVNSRYGRSYKEYRGLRDDDEFAAEFLADDVTNEATSGAVIAGVLGTIASIVALFMYPVILGIVGIALGCFAVAKGNKVLGFIAIGVGILSAIMPMVYNGPFVSMF